MLSKSEIKARCQSLQTVQQVFKLHESQKGAGMTATHVHKCFDTVVGWGGFIHFYAVFQERHCQVSRNFHAKIFCHLYIFGKCCFCQCNLLCYKSMSLFAVFNDQQDHNKNSLIKAYLRKLSCRCVISAKKI